MNYTVFKIWTGKCLLSLFIIPIEREIFKDIKFTWSPHVKVEFITSPKILKSVTWSTLVLSIFTVGIIIFFVVFEIT